MGSAPAFARLLACAALALAPSMTRAQETRAPVSRDAAPPAERVRIRTDTVLRYLPRYELTMDAGGSSASDRYYREVEQLPLYQLVSLDARHLAGDHVDIHIAAHAVTDASLPDEDELLAGDFALAFVQARPLSGLSLWGGRRFVTWGLPGGLHLDGAGVEQQSELGLFAELIAGRPVQTRSNTIGTHSEFDSPALAYGARVGYRQPGALSASASYLERWSHGLRADRVVGLMASARPLERLDLLGGGSVDVRAGIQQAHLRASYLVTQALEPELSYEHADPQKLLPSWSLLSVFASEVYDQAACALNARLSSAVRGRVEFGARRSHLPGDGHTDDVDGPADPRGNDAHLGVSAKARLHVQPAPYDREFVLEAAHRDEGRQRLLTARAGVSFRVLGRLRLSPMVGVALDEDDERRTAWLWRGAADLPLARRWDSGLVVDFARTPLSRGELRALLRVSYRPASEIEVR